MSYLENDLRRVKTGHLIFTEEGLKNFICNINNASAEDKRMLLDEYKRLIITNHVAEKVHNDLALTGESLKAHNDLDLKLVE
tara:strand:+ start:355 stop:600 length:246 start_codon:yes stop_codon:yes gene_type:complete